MILKNTRVKQIKQIKQLQRLCVKLSLILFFTSLSSVSLLQKTWGKSCDMALVDWSSEFQCITKLKADEDFRKIPYKSNDITSTMDRIQAKINKLPSSCQKELPSEYTLSPLLALSKYKSHAVLVSNISEIIPNLQAAMKSNGCDSIDTLFIIGHGDSGCVSVGAGIECDSKAEISTTNINNWEKSFKSLNGNVKQIQIVACHSGQGEKGEKLVAEMARIVGASTVAPVKEVRSDQDIMKLSNRERVSSTPKK
ncbi:MAG: DUF4347 domain-containing protein [Oligoflexia bacterium]|nr:DUF4347 domain-containing protein [Oligoflexia bacterium]